MTVESAFKRGEFFSVPTSQVIIIGRSSRHEGCGYIKLKGGTSYTTRESFGELAQMVAEDAEVE